MRVCAIWCFRQWIIDEKHIWIGSVFGTVLRNIGQIAVAVLILGMSVLVYLPFLLVFGCLAGTFTGMCAQLVIKRLKIYRDWHLCKIQALPWVVCVFSHKKAFGTIMRDCFLHRLKRGSYHALSLQFFAFRLSLRYLYLYDSGSTPPFVRLELLAPPTGLEPVTLVLG